MLTNISSDTHSTKHLQWLVNLFSQSLFLKSLSLHWKIELYALIRSHVLTSSRPTLTIVVIQSDHSYYQAFSSAYFLYILFLPTFFTSFSTFVCSLLSDDLCWLLIGYSLLDALFLIWLFPCLVVMGPAGPMLCSSHIVRFSILNELTFQVTWLKMTRHPLYLYVGVAS